MEIGNVALDGTLQGRKVHAALIGAGSFGSTIVSQARRVPSLKISAVADEDIEAAKKALRLAGAEDEEVAVCEGTAQAQRAMEAGKSVATTDASILFDLGIDIVVEATGSADAGARHAAAAIASGKHVAMVNKEADAAVGPILKAKADAAGVVYTAVDGDQHGLLIGMVRWARNLGMDVLCGGKALDGDLVVTSSPPALTFYSNRLDVSQSGLDHFKPLSAGSVKPVLDERRRQIGSASGARPWDLAEMTIVANATGLCPDTPSTHCPALWTAEIPIALCPKDLGGILKSSGVVEAVQILRGPHELSLHGGVFLVVRVEDEFARRVMLAHDTLHHPNGSTALILRPHHLLGIEAIQSILCAVLLKLPTGAIDYRPRYDVVYRAKRDLQKGSLIGDDHSPALTAQIIPAAAITPHLPLPAGLVQGNRLNTSVPAGAAITASMIDAPSGSILWTLRSEQDARDWS